MLKRDDVSAATGATGPVGRVPTGRARRPWMTKAVLAAVGVIGAMLGVRGALHRAGQVYDHCASPGHCSCDNAVGGCEGAHKAQELQGGVVSNVDR
jgi:hypothetical protein